MTTTPAPAHAIILVPGFFGFGTFGDKPAAAEDDKKTVAPAKKTDDNNTNVVRIQYFARVVEVLQKTLGGDDRIFYISSEPAPTGALSERAKQLHDTIVQTLGKGVKHVHLIGHSTGGVDVRLVANRGYAPLANDEDREQVLASIRSVITVSAPFRGAPIAAFFSRNHRTEYVVALLSLLSVLITMRDLRLGGRIAMLAGTILRYFGALSQPDALVVPMFLSGVNASTALQIQHFMGEIIADHGALTDLSPNAPHASENRGENLAATDFHPIKSFVTVAPKPPGYLKSLFTSQRILSVLYNYASTHATPPRNTNAGSFPGTNAWLGGSDDVRKAIASVRGINDGVVPAASQTIDGHAEGIVVADHLDIVGHYVGAGGNGTFFKSGADFDDGCFRTFWGVVANSVNIADKVTSA